MRPIGAAGENQVSASGLRPTRRAILGAPVVLWSSAARREPLHRSVELNPGESTSVRLRTGELVKVEVIEASERRDSIRNALRQARVRVRVNGEEAWLVSGNYRLPITVGGVQMDCPATRGLESNAGTGPWRLAKDVRLRLWPAGSPWIEPGTFDLPLKSRWFATDTQMSNEPTFVNGGDIPALASVYYHNDLDFGGAEALEEVYAATAGLVVSVRNEVHPEHRNSPARPRPDVIYLLDDRGWYYRYSHFQSIDPEIRLGARINLGQRLGLLGKEGGAGWSHLHFGIQAQQPSGAWGTEDAYAFVWENYLRNYKPAAIAVARPHHLARTGEEVELDGSLSWSAAGKIARYEWTLSGGGRAVGPRVRRRYEQPGTYSEILKITDVAGHTAWDFAVVQVLDMARLEAAGGAKAPHDAYPPTIHALYWPTMNVRPGQPIVFRVFTYRTREAEETWDFGDGSPKVTVRSKPSEQFLLTAGEYAETRHSYRRPGDYIVRVVSRNGRGETATAHLWVPVRA